MVTVTTWTPDCGPAVAEGSGEEAADLPAGNAVGCVELDRGGEVGNETVAFESFGAETSPCAPAPLIRERAVAWLVQVTAVP